MSKTMINSQDFKNMVALSRSHLGSNAEYVNSLNVFPVPDGDTGTNMSLSLDTGAEAVLDFNHYCRLFDSNNGPPNPTNRDNFVPLLHCS